MGNGLLFQSPGVVHHLTMGMCNSCHQRARHYLLLVDDRVRKGIEHLMIWIGKYWKDGKPIIGHPVTCSCPSSYGYVSLDDTLTLYHVIVIAFPPCIFPLASGAIPLTTKPLHSIFPSFRAAHNEYAPFSRHASSRLHILSLPSSFLPCPKPLSLPR